MYLIIEGYYSDWNVIGYVKTEEEAIQYCLDGECYYEEIKEIKVGQEIMQKKRYTKVGICFRTADLENWTNTDIRKDYSDKSFKEIERKASLTFGWVLLEHLSDGNIEKSIKILNDEFNFLKYEMSKLETKELKNNFLKNQNIYIER